MKPDRKCDECGGEMLYGTVVTSRTFDGIDREFFVPCAVNRCSECGHWTASTEDLKAADRYRACIVIEEGHFYELTAKGKRLISKILKP